MNKHDGAWFAPKSIGHGSALPVAWQGWALLSGYFAVVLIAAFMWNTWQMAWVIGGSVLFFIATIAVVFIAKAKTRPKTPAGKD